MVWHSIQLNSFLDFPKSQHRFLTHKNADWKWTSHEQDSFEVLQNALSSDAVIGYYEIGRETKLKVDAGPNGLGLILLQKKEENRWQPVECARRSQTETAKRYSQLEREALAVRWACERCYMYLIGSTFVVETDHKPLLPLFFPATTNRAMVVIFTTV